MSLKGYYMKKVTSLVKNLMKDESGQGATEYILLLVVVVAIALIFKDKLKSIVTEKMTALGTDIGGFGSQN
jgi:Flp pilus assembly pilin Flp